MRRRGPFGKPAGPRVTAKVLDGMCLYAAAHRQNGHRLVVVFDGSRAEVVRDPRAA